MHISFLGFIKQAEIVNYIRIQHIQFDIYVLLIKFR